MRRRMRAGHVLAQPQQNAPERVARTSDSTWHRAQED